MVMKIWIILPQNNWVMATYVETSKAFKSDIRFLRETANRLGAKL